jgi:hypothetical protein
MSNSVNHILTGAVIVLSLMLSGNGITGYVTREPLEYCSSNKDCIEPKVCCLFYDEDSGVCSDDNICSKISEVTKEQQVSSDELESILYGEPSGETAIDKDEELNVSYTTQIIFGGLLFIIAVLNVLLYIENRKEPEKKGKLRS